MDVDGVNCRVLSLDVLINAKRAANRLKDRSFYMNFKQFEPVATDLANDFTTSRSDGSQEGGTTRSQCRRLTTPSHNKYHPRQNVNA